MDKVEYYIEWQYSGKKDIRVDRIVPRVGKLKNAFPYTEPLTELEVNSMRCWLNHRTFGESDRMCEAIVAFLAGFRHSQDLLREEKTVCPALTERRAYYYIAPGIMDCNSFRIE